MTPDEIRQRGLLPAGFMPLPHVKQATGGQVFPDRRIDEIRRQEDHDLRRFDVNFDLPDHLTPEFPPPIFLTTQPHLGDVSRGQLLTIKNSYPRTSSRSFELSRYRPCRSAARLPKSAFRLHYRHAAGGFVVTFSA
jgi:cytochrome c peroxidase